MTTQNWESHPGPDGPGPEGHGTGNEDSASAAYWTGARDYDPETVRFFDIAHEGAQVRVLAGAAVELESMLFSTSPRAVVLLPTDAVARACAEYVADQQDSLPVVITQHLPTFVGALDTVVVLGERAACEWASHAVLTAAGRGAQTIYLGPARGPLAEDARDATGTLSIESLPTAEGTSPARYIAGLESIFRAYNQPATTTVDYLEGLADELDRELETLSPERDATVNPARVVRDFAADSYVIHTGPLGPVAATLWATAGLGGTYVEPELVPHVLERRAADNAGHGPDRDDPFYDPFLDGPPLVGSKVLMWGGAPTSALGSPGAAAGSLAERQDLLEVDSSAATTPPDHLAITATDSAAHPVLLLVRALAAAAMNKS